MKIFYVVQQLDENCISAEPQNKRQYDSDGCQEEDFGLLIIPGLPFVHTFFW